MRTRHGLIVVMFAFFAVATILAWSALGGDPGIPVAPPVGHDADDTTYPGGSPFPPGGEPSLTHEARAYWTTLGGLETQVEITAPGRRPTQTSVTMIREGQNGLELHATIDSECKWKFRIGATRPRRAPDVRVLTAKGHGTVLVKVFGWTTKDFQTPPTVVAKYYKGKTLVGQTGVDAKPIAATILKKEAAKEAKPAK